MSYLLDKKIKRKKIKNIALVFLIFICLFYFRAEISKGLASTSHFLFRPVLILGKNIGQGFSQTNVIFHNRKTLLEENDKLKLRLNEIEFQMANYNSILNENLEIKEILGRRKENIPMVLASILAKPNRSLYDTLIIDVGKDQGISSGQRVFALGNIPIGYIAEVENNSSKVILYTNTKEKTQVIISGKNIYMEMVGRGGGNFEMILPKDLILVEGTEIILPGITSYLVARVETIITDPRDSLQKALLVSPINIQELKFVQVEK